jgi:predicted Zn-dependent peptidase
MTAPLRLPRFPYTKTTLTNGLDVIVRHQGHLPLVAVNLWYHVGSKNEERRQRGFAHLFEHLMFEGSAHYPGDFFKPLQRLGATINGSTSTDRTNYFADVPAAHVELTLAMESDRMGYLLPALDDAKLRIQKDVVKNEYRQNYANRPYGMVWRHLAEALYPPGHPYSWLTIGVMEDVEAATRDDVEAFFRRYYVPSNASLCLVGDIDEDRALALAERYFGPLAGGAQAIRPWATADRPAGDIEIALRDRVELDRVYLVWPTVPHFHTDDAALLLLADILARGKSSRLYRKLVVDREIAQDVAAFESGRELAGVFGVTVTLRPGQARAQVRALIDEELASIAASGVADEELERVQNGRLAGFFYALENLGGFGGVADRLNAYNVFLGDPGRITSDFQRYQDVTAETLSTVARRYLVGHPRVALEVIPNKNQGSASLAGPPLDRSIVPVSPPAARYRAPRPEIRTLASGLPLWVIPHRELPIVALTLVVAGGASQAPTDRAGLAQLTATMLGEGTVTRDALALARATEDMGTSLGTSCGWDGAYVSLQCLAPHLMASLDLAVDLLRNPTFPQSEWNRVQGQALAGLLAERDSAEARTYRGLLRTLYGPDHPYRLPIDGAEPTVAGIGRADLQQFHDRYHGPSQAACIVAGDVDADAIARALDARLDGWTGPTVARAEVTIPARGDHPRILLLDRPGAVQAVVRVGHVGLPRLDPDYTDILVLNQILGGQFTSRLNTRLREEKGFTYGIRSQFDCRRSAGPFSIGASLQSDRLDEALVEIRHEVEALVGDRPPTLPELDDARRALIEGQARQFETPSALVSRYASLFVHGLPPDHHTHFAERLDGLSVASLAAAASRQIRPRALVAVVVADAARTLDRLRRIDWAEVEVITD